MKEAGLSEQQARPLSSSSPRESTDELVSRQLAAAEAAQKQAERVTKQLMETQQKMFSAGPAGGGEPNQPTDARPLTNREKKTHNWYLKTAARRAAQQKQKYQRDGAKR